MSQKAIRRHLQIAPDRAVSTVYGWSEASGQDPTSTTKTRPKEDRCFNFRVQQQALDSGDAGHFSCESRPDVQSLPEFINVEGEPNANGVWSPKGFARSGTSVVAACARKGAKVGLLDIYMLPVCSLAQPGLECKLGQAADVTKGSLPL